MPEPGSVPSAGVALVPWAEEDLPLMQMLLGDPEVMAHLGGPESPEKILVRHRRYLELSETDFMFKIASEPGAEALGSIGFWEKEWRGGRVYETGWMVLPAYQGRGIATRAAALVIERARQEGRYRFLHAFPSVSNPASNGICRKLGFSLLEACDFEYPLGSFMQVNDWRLELF